MTARIAEAEHARGAADAAAQTARAAAADHQRRAEQAAAAADDATARAGQLADELAAATGRAETAEAAEAAHAASLEHLRGELALVRADARVQIDAADRRATQAENDRDRTRADGTANVQTIAALRDELTTAQAEAATATSALTAATARAEAAEQRLDALFATTSRGTPRSRRSARTPSAE